MRLPVLLSLALSTQPVSPVSETSTSAHTRFLTTSEAEIYRLAREGEELAARFRLQRDQCRDLRVEDKAEIAKLRRRRKKVRVVETLPGWVPWVMIGAGIGGVVLGVWAGTSLGKHESP